MAKEVGLYDGKYRYCENCSKLNKYRKSLTYFETEEELTKMTGLSHEELWENGFDLDDWDFGFAWDIRFEINWQLEMFLDRYNCYGKKVTTHNGINYMMLITMVKFVLRIYLSSQNCY